MQNMQQPDERPTNVRLESLENRLDSLEQVGEGGHPAIRLAGIEFRLDHVEENLRDLKDDVNRRFGEVDKRFDAVDKRFDAVDKRFDRLETRIDGSTNRLVTMLGIYTGIITLAVFLSQLLLP